MKYRKIALEEGVEVQYLALPVDECPIEKKLGAM